MSVSISASLVVTLAVVQTIVFLFLLRAVDLYEREPMSILGLMALWGAVGATSLASVGNIIGREMLPPDIAAVFGRAIYAPVVEEIAKGAALFVFVLISMRVKGAFGIPRFEGVTDGIVYGAAIGLGFAFTEDLFYLLLRASDVGLEGGVSTFLTRRTLGTVMLHHAIYSAIFGLGLGLATWVKGRALRFFFPIAGLIVAMAMHAFNNGWVSFVLVRRYGFESAALYLGQREILDPAVRETIASAAATVRVMDLVMLAALAALVYLWLRYQRSVIRDELQEEAATGLISATELELLPLYWRRTYWYWQLVKTGQWERRRLLSRIHNELVNLAFTKRRRRRGDSSDYDVHRSRELITRLKAQKMVFL